MGGLRLLGGGSWIWILSLFDTLDCIYVGVFQPSYSKLSQQGSLSISFVPTELYEAKQTTLIIYLFYCHPLPRRSPLPPPSSYPIPRSPFPAQCDLTRFSNLSYHTLIDPN